jgi:hypothetical protein
MSSYFERMASGVLQPARAIHPVLGSLWAAPSRSAELETSVETTSPAMAAREPVAREIDHARAPRGEARPFAPIADVAEPLSQPRESNRSAQPFQPIAEVEPFIPAAATELRAAQSEQAAEAIEVSEVIYRGPSAAAAFTPLVAKTALSPRSHSPVAAIRPQPAAQPPREPDEIEIHIGRIEVTAAPQQAAPRPIAQPARKSLDLGEYLRRDRRSR